MKIEGIEKWIGKGVDLLYPRRCPVCQEIVGEGRKICPECKKQLIFVKEPTCMKCGKPLFKEEERKEYCADCEKKQHSFLRNYGVLLYEEQSKKSMYAFKYQNKREFADWYTETIWQCYGQTIEQLGIEAVIPVPIYKKKRRKRGYNQAELLAVRLAKKLEVPCFRQGLVRKIDTKPQKELAREERYYNMQRAFSIGKITEIVGTVLLVDDIYTTGSTMEACTKVLQQAGIKNVYGCTVCIGRGS